MQTVSNTEILLFIMGYQGGTLSQCATELGVTTEEVIAADYADMQRLMRMAQRVRNAKA